MEWIKAVTIVFDSTLTPDQRGPHNGKYQAVESRLRSDGKFFYLTKHSKVTTLGRTCFDHREELWNDFLAQDTDKDSFTESEFFAEVERQRQELNGAYL